MGRVLNHACLFYPYFLPQKYSRTWHWSSDKYLGTKYKTPKTLKPSSMLYFWWGGVIELYGEIYDGGYFEAGLYLILLGGNCSYIFVIFVSRKFETI